MSEPLKRARYSEVERRLWNDGRFRNRLSPIPPCGQGLWLYLLTTPELGALPGLVIMGEAAMAEHLGWELEAFRKAFAEVTSQGMAEADWASRLVITLKSIGKQKPESPNVVRSWHQQWLDVPDSPLKAKYYSALRDYVEGLGEGFAKAFAEAIADPSPNQEQEQEQEQEQDTSSVASESADSDHSRGTSEDEVNAATRPAQGQLALASRVARSPSTPEDAHPSKALEREVFDYWLSGWRRIVGGTRAPALDAKRRRKIRARFAERFTAADLKRAIDGLWGSSWHVENGRTDIELVCRDASHVERFMGLLMPTSDLAPVNSAILTGPTDHEFVPPPAKLFEVMESVRRAFSPPDDSPGAPTLWKARPTLDTETMNRGAHVG